MAIYTFENMSASDAAAFTSADYLLFQSATPGTLSVTDTAGTTGPLGNTNESFTLSDGTHTLTFSAAELSAASQVATPQHLVFNNNDTLTLGLGGISTAPTADTFTVHGTVGHAAVAYGFAGGDSITGSVANDTINGGAGDDRITGSSSSTDSSGNFTESDYLLGGAGNDTIVGGAGNDHIYGNLFTSTQGAADGNDSITAGAGKDYVNGNAGNDTIDGGAGDDKLYGGAGNDVITGGANNDYLQGNKGEDTLTGGSGNDTLHGGADNDVLNGTSGNNELFGDNGDDTLNAGTGHDTLTGGAGSDHFVFDTGSALATNLTTPTTDAAHDQVSVIMDFTHGTDAIQIAVAPADATHVGTSATTFATIDEAYTFAKQALTGHLGTDVEVLQVGTDSVLFYSDGGTAVDSAITLHGVTASTITFHDFV